MINLLKQYVWQLLTIIVAAVSYSFLYGLPLHLPLWFILLNVFVYASSIILVIVAIKTTMKYSLNLAVDRGGRICYLFVLGFLTCIFLIGIESVTAYLSSEHIFILFKENIQQRFFIDILVCIIIIMSNRLSTYRRLVEHENDIELSDSNHTIQKNDSTSSEQADYVDLAPSVCHNDVPEFKIQSENLGNASVHTQQTKRVPITQVSVRIGQKIRIIQISEIISIKANGDYVSICTSDGIYLKEQTMKFYEQNLPNTDFLRIHRSYIVHLVDIIRIEKYGQMQQVEMRNGERIRISDNGYKLLRSSLGL